MTINVIEPDDRSKYEGIVNNSIDSMFQIKDKNWLVVAHSNALTFYST